MSDTYITLLIPTSIIPSWDPGQDEAENRARARIHEGCQWLKANAKRLVVVINPRIWIAFGVNPDSDRATAILFTLQVADVGSFLISLINGDITRIDQPNGSELQYSLEIGGNKPPPPVPHSTEDDAFDLARSIGNDCALVEGKGDGPPPAPPPGGGNAPAAPAKPAGDPTEEEVKL